MYTWFILTLRFTLYVVPFIITTERESVKLLIINNLASGYQEGAIYDFMRAFTRDGDEVCLRSTDGTTDLREFLSDASSFDLVVASGGDGTVSTVLSLLANSGTPVLPFPAGTANLLALNLALPTEPHALAKLAREGSFLDFDLGEIEVNGERYDFTIMAGAGYDATIMQGAEASKQLLGPMAYFTSAIANPTPQRSRFTIQLDDRTVEAEGIGVLAANFSKIQFDISVARNSSPCDGLLDIVVLPGQTAFDLLPAIGAALLDHAPDGEEPLQTFRTTQATITADPPLQIQYDGEVIDLSTPFSVRVLPGAARIVLSDEGRALFE